MISTERTTSSSLPRTIILIGVIACLCFSVGEGLRLTPFPVGALALVDTTNTHLNATPSFETSLRKYGPIDVPVRVQTRGKRQAVDFGYPPSQSKRKLAELQILRAGAPQPVRITSLLFRSRPAGRAPPFIS